MISFEIRKLFMKPVFFRTFKQWQWTDEDVQSYVDHRHYVFNTAQCICLITWTCTCPFTSTFKLLWSLGLRSSSSLIISRLSQCIHDNTSSQHKGHDLWKVFLKSTGTPQPRSRKKSGSGCPWHWLAYLVNSRKVIARRKELDLKQEKKIWLSTEGPIM